MNVGWGGPVYLVWVAHVHLAATAAVAGVASAGFEAAADTVVVQDKAAAPELHASALAAVETEDVAMVPRLRLVVAMADVFELLLLVVLQQHSRHLPAKELGVEKKPPTAEVIVTAADVVEKAAALWVTAEFEAVWADVVAQID